MSQLNFNPTANQLIAIPKTESQLSLSSEVQTRIIEQVLLQSGGVGLGMCIAFIGAILLSKWLGVGTLVTKLMEKADSGTESLRALANALTRVTEDLKDNHSKYIGDHKDILDSVSEVKDIVKDINRKLDK